MIDLNIFKKLMLRFRSSVRLIFSRAEYSPSGSIRENEIVGSIAHAVGVNVGKLTPQVIRKDAKGTVIKNDHLSKLLSLRPCPEMSTFDFLYKMGSTAICKSNAFAIIFWNDDYTAVERIQPVSTTDHCIFEDDSGNVFLRFTWEYDGKTYTVPYDSVIHLRSRFSEKRFLGTAPDEQLQASVDMLDITYNGIKNAVRNSASLRGYLKYNNIADEEELENKVDEFKSAYMRAENEGGIAALDSTYEFKELSQKPYQIPAQQLSFFRENINRYYIISEKILTSTYNEAEWNAFYEAIIEPIAIQLSLEFTYKIFTERERGCGNKIVFTTNHLQYATLTTRSTIGKELFDRGAITINQLCELHYLPTFEGGDVRMVSLNYVKADEQSLYQTGQNNSADPPNNSNGSVSNYIKSLLERRCESEKSA